MSEPHSQNGRIIPSYINSLSFNSLKSDANPDRACVTPIPTIARRETKITASMLSQSDTARISRIEQQNHLSLQVAYSNQKKTIEIS